MGDAGTNNVEYYGHSGHDSARMRSLESPIHGDALRHYIDTRVLSFRSPEATDGIESIEATYRELSTREKTDTLYGKLLAYRSGLQSIQQETAENPQANPDPIDPYLIEEIGVLWSDPAVQEMAIKTYNTARLESKAYRLSELGKNWQSVNANIDATKARFEAGTRALFLHEITRADPLSALEGKTAGWAKKLIALKAKRKAITTLGEMPHIAENTDIAAQVMYEQLTSYHAQLTKEGFVWLPSREGIHVQTIEALQNGRWPVLIGEAGTGKSEQADAAAVALTGEQPTHVICGPKTNERHLIADKAIDEAGSYEEYGPITQAATGYVDSRNGQYYKRGRIVRLDELGRLGSESYSILKDIRQKKPSTPDEQYSWENGKPIPVNKLLNDKPVLAGFAAIGTTNPVGPRYPDRTEPDPALSRELAPIIVDYPPMSHNNPEIYEFMLAALMDRNNHIPVSHMELSPAYTQEMFPEDRQVIFPDGTLGIGQDVIIDDPADIRHGTLYRLSFAIRSLQDAFNYGNSQEALPPDVLRYSIDTDGKIQVQNTGGDPLTLEKTTITLGEIASWLRGFHERTLKDDVDFQTNTLTEWIQLKLETYVRQTDPVDRDKVRALFDYYSLFSPPPSQLEESLPLTHKQIGYLSPRVPRPLYVAEQTSPTGIQYSEKPAHAERVPQLNKDVRVMLEDGTTLVVTPESLNDLNLPEES